MGDSANGVSGRDPKYTNNNRPTNLTIQNTHHSSKNMPTFFEPDDLIKQIDFNRIHQNTEASGSPLKKPPRPSFLTSLKNTSSQKTFVKSNAARSVWKQFGAAEYTGFEEN